VHLDRRWYAREEGRVQPLEENVDVGQICETESEGIPPSRARRHRHLLKVNSHAGRLRALMGDDDRAQGGIPPDVP
jgi:hypothetical protein